MKLYDNCIDDLLYCFSICDNKYLFGIHTLSMYNLNKADEHLIELFNNYTLSGVDNASSYFQGYPAIKQAIKKEAHVSKQYIDMALKNNSSQPEIIPFKNAKNLKELTLVVSSDCNMKCKYCYLDSDSKGLMSFEVASKAIDVLFDHSESDVQISFFGGEPFLNLSVIQQSTEYAFQKAKEESRKVSFDLVTNGTIASRKIVKFLKDYDFRIGISLDGSEQIHDSNRVYKSGEGTYRDVYTNVVEHYSTISDSTKIKFLSVLHPDNYGELENIYDYFKNISSSTGILFNRFGKVNCIDKREEHPFLKERERDYIDVIIRYAKKVLAECVDMQSIAPLNEFGRMDTLYLGQLIAKVRVAEALCASGIGTIMVYPDGNIGGCRQLDPEFYDKAIWGNINDLSAIDEEARTEGFRMARKARAICSSCWIRNVCGGSCPAVNLYSNSIDIPDELSCDMDKITLKLSLWFKDKIGGIKFQEEKSIDE